MRLWEMMPFPLAQSKKKEKKKKIPFNHKTTLAFITQLHARARYSVVTLCKDFRHVGFSWLVLFPNGWSSCTSNHCL